MVSKPRLISVDDELEMAKLVANVAELAGFEVRIAGSVQDFFRIADDFPPDIIVTDICMPDADGIELVQKLAEQSCTAGILLISGYHGRYLPITEMIARERHLQFLGKLKKPFRVAELQLLMQQAFDWCRESGRSPA